MIFKEGFDQQIENLYQNDINILNLKQVRIILFIFAILYASFFISDYFLLHDYLMVLFFIRFCIVIPMFAITVLLTYKKSFVENHQRLMMFNFILAGSGISIMLIIMPDNFIYYGGMFMIYFSGYLLINLDFVHASIGGWSTLIVYFLGFVIYQGRITPELLYSSMFFIGSNIIGMMGSYNFEVIKRKNFLSNLKINTYNYDLKNEVVKQTQDIMKINIEIVFALVRLVETRDHNTGVHTENVVRYCTIIAEGLDDKEFIAIGTTKEVFKEVIKVASVLHDIGKVGISDTILNKKGKLDEYEFELMKTHTLIGSDILEKIQKSYPKNEFINMGLDIARSHHERFDGSGYPDGLKGKVIPLSARIMAICDVYDALTTQRTYKEAYSSEKAVELIKQENGSHFDPMIVEVFLENQNQFSALL